MLQLVWSLEKNAFALIKIKLYSTTYLKLILL